MLNLIPRNSKELSRNRPQAATPASPPMRRKILFEALENRLLLSADLATPGIADALVAGLTSFTDRLDNFLDAEPILNTPLPLVVRPDDTGPQTVNVAATLSDLLSVPVDFNSDGVIDPAPGSIENLLDVLDTDVSGPGFGHVDVRELLLGGLVNKITDAGISAFEASNPPGATIADYLNQTSFDTTIGDLSLTVFATDASNAHEVSADVTLTLSFGNSLPLDLGIGADDLGISFPASTLDLDAELSLMAEVGVVTSGEAPVAADFFIETGTLGARASASVDPFNAAVNVGFLGAQVSGGLIDLTAKAAASLTDPRTADVIGFTDPASGINTLTGAALPTGATQYDLGFLLRIGDSDTREVATNSPVTIPAGPDFSALESQIQGLVDTAGFSGIVDVNVAGGALHLSLPAGLDVGPLGFASNELAPSTTLTADAAPALGGTVSFLLSADQALPKLVSLDTTGLADVAALVTALQPVLNAAFGAGTVTAANASGKLQLTSTSTLHVTRTLALDPTKITRADITSATLPELISTPSTAGSSVTVSLPVTVSGLPGFSVTGAAINFSGNPFTAGELAPPDENGNQRLSLTLGTPNFGELLNFNNLSVSGVISLLGQVADWMDGLKQSPFVSGVDIPFVEDALGSVLDMADAVRDTLLFDDNDTPDIAADDVTKLLDASNAPQFTTAQELATRLDAILPGPFSVIYDAAADELRLELVLSNVLPDPEPLSIDLGTSIGDFAGVSASGSIDLDASLGLSLTLGVYLGGATGDSLIDPATPLDSLNDNTGAGIKQELAVTGVADVRTIFGRLSSDAHFTVTTVVDPDDDGPTPATETDYVVNVTGTGDNSTVTSLVGDIVAGLPAALAGKLSVTAEGNRVKFTVTDASVDAVRISVPNATDTATTELGLSAGTVERTDGVLAFRTARDVPAIVGQLTGEAAFQVSVNGGPAQSVTIAQADTVDNPATTGSDEGNRNILDLVADVNRALAHKLTGATIADFSPGVGVSFTITLSSGNTLLDGQIINVTVPAAETAAATTISQLVLVVNDKIQSALITTLGAAVREDAGDDLTTALLLEARAVGDAIQIRATDPVVSGFTISDAAGLGLSAGSSAGLSDKLLASSQGSRLVFTAVDPSVTAFTVTATPGSVAATQLGIATATPGGTANEHDLVIYTRNASLNGGSFRVSLDGDTTIQGVIDSVADAAPKITVEGTPNQPAVILRVSADGTRLEAIDRSSGSGIFRIEPINASAAAAKLGILKADISNDQDTPDGVIQGLPLGGLTLADRLFLEDAVVSADLALSVPSVTIGANLGFVGVELTGSGGFGVDFSAGLKSPGATTAGGRITLTQLLDGLDDIGSIVATPTLVLDPANAYGNKLSLTLGTTPSFGALGIADPHVEIALLDLGNPFADPATAPQIQVRSTGLSDLSGLGNLFDASDLSLANILAGLDALVGFLNQFEAFGFLGEPLPVVGVSVNDLLGVAEQFAGAIQEFENDPAGSIQALEERLLQALGLPGTSDLIQFMLEVDDMGTPDTADDVELLRLNLGYSASFVEELGIDLDLSSTFPELGDVVQLAGAAGLQASGSLDLSLDFGFDLADPSNVYLFDTTGITANIAAAGTELTFRAALGPVGLFVKDGTASISASVTAGISDAALAGSNRVLVGELFSGGILSAIEVTPSGSISATLPAYFPTESISAGDITLEVPDLLHPGDITVNVPDFDIDPSKFSLIDNMMLALDGIDLFLSGLQDILDGEVFGLEMPLIGDSLADAAQFIADFRDDFIGTFREKLGTVASPTENIISQLLFDLLSADTDGSGPDIGLNLLRDFDPADGETDVSIEDIILATNISDPTTQPDEVFMQWNMVLGGQLLDVGTGIGFDLGIPGIGLSTEGDINLNIGWELDFGFGLSFQDGFYLDISSPSELTVSVDADIEGLEVVGRLGFLQIVAVERDDPAHPENTHVHATFGIDVYNRRDEDDTKLGFSELGGIGIAPTVQADALADLELALELNSELVPGASTNFPRVVAGFELRWALDDGAGGPLNLLTADIGNAISEGLQLVEFQDVSLDLGSFISDVVGPIVEQVQKVTKPIQPIIEFLTTPIPVISDLGPPVTLLDIAAAFGSVNPALIKALADVVTLVNSIPTSAETLLINFGDFTIFDADATGDNAYSVDDLVSQKPKNPDTVAKPAANDFDTALAGKPASETKSFAQKLKNGGFGGGFSFPLLESPSDIFGLLLGDDVTLIGYDLAPLEFDFKWTQFFSIFGPLGVSITAQAGATIDFAFGYDTAGIREFADSGFRNPELLFDGFFVSDNPTDVTGAGPDLPELTLTAGFSAAAELNLGIARAGVAGGIFGEIDFNLFDPNHDGKVRITEIVNSIVDQARFGEDLAFLAPLAMFDISGEIFAKLFAFLEINLFFFSFSEEWNITPPITLLEFDIPFTRTPSLADELAGGTFQLNLGEFAAQRVNGSLADGDETFVVTGNASGLSVTAFGITKTYAPDESGAWTRIIALGGEGNDTIDFSGVSGAIEFEIDGGAGDDHIYLTNSSNPLISASGRAVIRGGLGDDEIWGGLGDDTIWGDEGVDTIHGAGGADLIFGDDGSISDNGTPAVADDSYFVVAGPKDIGDILYGDGGDPALDGNDILFGGGGDDEIHGGGGADLVIGDAGKVLRGGPLTEVRDHDAEQGGVDTVFGDGGNDRIYSGGGGDIINAGTGDDLVLAGAGRDSVTAGEGSDTVFGGAGNDTVFGGEHDDFLFGDAGNDVIHGEGGNDEIRGGIGADRLTGGANEDKLWGEADPDVLEGNEGDDRLDGGYGNDSLSGGGGSDTLYSGFGSDTVDGGAARDAYFVSTRGGRTSELTTIYDSGALGDGVDELTVNGTVENDVFLLRAMADAYVPGGTETAFIAKINAGGAGLERYNYRNIEFITLNGFVGDDRFVSDDTKAGVTINGGPGEDDFQIGQMFKSRRDTTAETANIAADDVFDVGGTVETTRGWLSNGVSAPMTINGGDDNDSFTVFRNKAVLTLSGGDGDDVFTVRAFALAGSVDDDRARTDMKGDGGADLIQYAINAPVGIDGGDGFDTVRVIGTEFKDDFVVTDGGVFGAGLNVTYVNVERLTVDGAEGDDRYFVLSTNAGVVTEIAGGLGSDTFLMGGSPNGEPIAVISNDLKGHSGIILHDVESVTDGWDGIPVEGLSANIADNDEDFIVITPSDGVSRVSEGATLGGEGWVFDTYTVALTRAPEDEVVIAIQAPVLTPEDQARGAKSLEFEVAPGVWATTHTLHFTTVGWATSQTVKVRAADDAADEGTSFGLINHVVASAGDEEYDELPVLSVKVQILDNDEAGVIVRPTGTETRVVEGFPGAEEGLAFDTYDVILARPSTQTVTVNLTAFNDQVDLSATTLVFAPGEVSKTVTVTARDDGVLEGFHSDFIRATVASADADVTVSQPRYQIDFSPDLAGVQNIPADDPQAFVLLRHKPVSGTVQLWVNDVLMGADTYEVFGNTLVFVDEFGQPDFISGKVEVAYSHLVEGYDQTPVDPVVVDVYDKQAPTVLVMQSAGSTDVIEGGATDGYRVVLTSDPGEGETVTVNVAPQKTRSTAGSTAFFEQQVTTSAAALTFTGGAGGDWMTPQTVTVTAIDDTIVDGSDTQVFDSSVRTVNKIRGPLYIEGASGEGSISLPEPLMLPGEKNIRASTGEVLAFTASSGQGAIESMTVETADLETARVALGLASLGSLAGKTVEITTGPGLDRIFQILAVTEGPDTSVLLLQNPSQVDAGPAADPTTASKYAITGLSANFFVTEADQVDFMMVFDADSVANEEGTLTSQDIDGTVKGRVIGFGMGPDIEIGGGLRGGGITYGDMEVVRVDLGRGNDQVTVDYATRRPDDPDTPQDESAFYTLTLLNTGLGDDTVTVTLTDGEDGAFALRAGAGADHVFGQLSTRPLVVFGEEGDDEIWGGSADDILFGDIGRVDYVNGGGEIVTRLGHTWPQNPVNPPVSSATATSVTDISAAFPTEYGGLVGLAVQAISPAGLVQNRIISANTGDTLTVSLPWTIVPDSTYFYRISMLPEDQTDGLVRGPRVLWTIENETGGVDTIHGEGGADTVIGGAAGDFLHGGEGDDLLAGDNARLDFDPATGLDGPTELVLARAVDPTIGGADTMEGNAGQDILIGGTADDTLSGDTGTVDAIAGDGNDLMFGDHGQVDFRLPANANFTAIFTGTADGGGGDLMYGNGADDIMLGQQGFDRMFGGDGDDDLWGGHNVAGGNDTGDAMDGGAGFDVLAGDNAIILRRSDTLGPLVRSLAGTTLFHGYDGAGGVPDGAAAVTGALQGNPGMGAGDFTRDITLLDHAADTAPGPFGSDRMAGGAGDDLMFGQLGDDVMLGDGSVTVAGNLVLLVEAAGDGDDYMEGNGGADTMYGNLGQDDMLGGSSDLFGLATPAQRPDGDDTIYGGAGTDAGRYHEDAVDLHARDADVILGDNGRIFRVVGTGGTSSGGFLTFNYDAAYAEPIRVIPRAYDLLDYTPGTGATADIGGMDLVFGESGNDIIHGMGQDDILFGNAGDDDLYGGAGSDWMSGGNGTDGMLGDDGRIFTSRNGLAEPLHGLTTPNLQQVIAAPGDWLTATLYTAGELNKAVDLEPFDQGGDDTLYGGLGDDFMHGGAGVDGMSGAEAEAPFYDAAAARFAAGTAKPALVFDEATGRFTAFDNTQPLQKIAGFHLNFEATDGGGAKVNDGNDRLFGDLGHDWLVGGTNSDHLYGGYGNDVMNGDDNLDTTGTDPVTGEFGDADLAFGGAGRDQLIANTGADRLIDWTGEFNAYWVPFSAFGKATVSRGAAPHIPEFLYALSRADGADFTRPGDPARNGEPNGELGLVRQGDPDWGAQHGGPADPQPGNGKDKKDTQR